MPVIDADTHVIETELTWEFLSQNEKAFRPTTFTAEDGEKSFWVVDGQSFPRAPKDGKGYPAGTRDLSDPRQRLLEMDRLGVDIQVVIPSFFLGANVRKPEVELALVRSYNRFMAEVCNESSDRLRWVIVPALQSIEETLEELDFGAGNGGCGVLFRGTERERLLSDPYFFPLYEKASELNLPICVHVGTGNPVMREQTDLLGHAFSSSALPMLGAFHALLLSDLPMRFPSLRFGFLEAGSQWIPFVLQQASRFFSAYGRDDSLGNDPLGERRFFVAVETDDDLPYLVGRVGHRNLMLGTDYGHSDTGTEIFGHAALKARTDLKADVTSAIADANAVRFFGF